MTPAVQSAKQRLLRELKAFRWSLGIVAAYLVLKAILFWLSTRTGMIAPTSPSSLSVWLLGFIVLGLRLCVVFVVPGLVVYRLLERLRR